MTENNYLKWMTANTPSMYWNDSAVVSEIEEAMANGATGVTTNPFLVTASLRADNTFWKETLPASDASLKGDEKAEALLKGVTGYLAEKLSPLRKNGFGQGYVCAQTNPSHPGEAEYMIAHAKTYAAWAPNIVIKLPATRAGLRAYEECAALGLNVAATVSFTVPQTLAIGEAFQRGARRARANGIQPGLGIAVLMAGRLDDYLRDVMLDTKASCGEDDIICSGIACLKRSYEIFCERGYECVLMPAAGRGPYHVTELAGAKMIMSITPKSASQLLNVTKLEERIHVPVDAHTLKRLQTMPEFVKAYEPRGLTVDEFISYGATNRTLTQFAEAGWKPLLSL